LRLQPGGHLDPHGAAWRRLVRRAAVASGCSRSSALHLVQNKEELLSLCKQHGLNSSNMKHLVGLFASDGCPAHVKGWRLPACRCRGPPHTRVGSSAGRRCHPGSTCRCWLLRRWLGARAGWRRHALVRPAALVSPEPGVVEIDVEPSTASAGREYGEGLK
jgi:hypothetical protein